MTFDPSLFQTLRNSIRYDAPHTPFCDGFSHFSVAFPADQPLGPGWLHPKATLSTYHLAEPLCELWFELEDGQMLACRRTDLESLPHLAREQGHFGNLSIRAEHLFSDPTTLISEFTFTARSEAVAFRPRWLGRLPGETQTYMLPYFVGAKRGERAAFLTPTGDGFFGGLRSGTACDLPQAALRISAPGLGLWVGNEPCWTQAEESRRFHHEIHYAFRSSSEVRLEAGASVRFRFATTLVCCEANAVLEIPPEAAAIPFEELEILATKRFLFNINSSAPPSTTPALVSLPWRARFALLRNGLAPSPGGEFGEDIACLCASDSSDFSCVFFWDTLFSSVAVSDFHGEYAKGAIRTAFTRQDLRDGSCPERKFQWSVPARMAQQSPQSPLASWALRRYLSRHPEAEFQRELYPKLVANHRFWEHYSDTDRDGLAEFRWSGQVSDNSPMWDAYSHFADGAGCGWVPPIASVPLNCFLHWDAQHLARHAADLGRNEEARGWLERASALGERLMKVCYCKEENRFWDYNHHTRTHTRVKTFWMFWPLFAGIEMPTATRDELLKTLLDRAHFFGPIPFPSVAYDEPSYDPRGYWRGRAWPHISYFLLQTLVRFGYEKEAKAAARRLLSWFSRQSGFLENICTHAGETKPHGFPDYNWGCAAAYLIATGDYLRGD